MREILGEWRFYFSKLNCSFISVVLIISCLIFFYRFYYIEQTKKRKIFTWLLLLFILAMCFLLLRGNIWRLFIGWDGLGVSSYCLVIYYLNWKSQNRGQLTILSNRVGDLFLLILLGFRVVENWSSQFFFQVWVEKKEQLSYFYFWLLLKEHSFLFLPDYLQRWPLLPLFRL